MFKKLLIYVVGFVFLVFNMLPVYSSQLINLVYPEKTVKKIDASSTYFIGNTVPKSNLTINGVPVKLHDEGIFVKVMPLRYGNNSFKLVSVKNGQSATKNVTINVPHPEKSLSSWPMQISENTLKPKGTSIYSPGDIINVSFKGSPGHRASFSIGNKIQVAMTELPPEVDRVKQYVLGEIYGMPNQPIKGIYNGIYEVKSSDNINNEPLKVHMSDGRGHTKSVLAATNITTWRPFKKPKVAEIITDKAAVRTGAGDSRMTPLPKGVKLHLIGYENGYYRYWMGAENEGFIPASNIKLLPDGTPVPFSEARTVNAKKSGNSTFINIPLKTKLPFNIEQSVDQKVLTLFLYGAKADTDIIKYDFSDKYINQIKWSQPYKNVYKLEILFNKDQQWGYDYFYKGSETEGNLEFILRVKYPPNISIENPLDKKIIAIDPGHGGYEKGSMGFGFFSEKDINLQISHKLAKMLENQGAKVILTRTIDKDVSIYDRPEIAAKSDADILISIHNNAIPDGRDPNIEHGSSSYYYHPMACPLAKSIQTQMLKQLNLGDFGFYYDNLALTREYRMPSVLIEVAFMINPEEYLLLKTPVFQQKSATAILTGIKKFFIEAR